MKKTIFDKCVQSIDWTSEYMFSALFSFFFYNPMIHIGGKIFSKKQLFDSNIRFINDNIEEDGTFLT